MSEDLGREWEGLQRDLRLAQQDAYVAQRKLWDAQQHVARMLDKLGEAEGRIESFVRQLLAAPPAQVPEQPGTGVARP